MLDSNDWDVDNQSNAVINPGQVYLDGNAVSWDDLRSILQVRRIAGDETLGETIGLALYQKSLDVEIVYKRVSAKADNWSRSWDSFRISAHHPPHDLVALVRELDEKDGERKILSLRGEEMSTALNKATRTLAHLQQLSNIVDQMPSLEDYRKAWSLRQELAQQISVIERSLMNRSGNNPTLSEGEFRRLTKRVRIRRDAHTRALFAENGILSALELSSRPSSAEIAALLRASQQRLQELENNRKSQFAAGSIRDTAASIEQTLLSLPQDLHGEVVVELDRSVTVDELAGGLARRRESLRDVPKSSTVLSIEREIKDISERIDLLFELPAVMTAARRKEENYRQADDDLENFFDLSETERADREVISEELESRREQFAKATNVLLLALLRLRTATGTETTSSDARHALELIEDEEEDVEDSASTTEIRIIDPSALASEIEEVVQASRTEIQELNAVSLSTDWETILPSVLEQCERDIVGIRREQEFLFGEKEANELVLEQVRTSVADLRAALASFAASLSTADEWEKVRSAADHWFRAKGSSIDILPGLVSRLRSSAFVPKLLQYEELLVEFATDLTELIDALEESAGVVRDQWGLATSYMTREAHNLAPRLVHSAGESWQFTQLNDSDAGRLLQTWVEGEVASILSQEVLREELFEGAAEVDYDLDARSVVWRSKEGRRRRRPLEAFSSGEQVFAYTRAKLESLRPIAESSEHFLIFLDEFGAFVARDRFGQLMHYVQTDVIGTIADQVIVMLPTSDSDSEFEARKESAAFATADYLVESLAVQERLV
ncbi:hypothetical protein GTU73_18225 [Rathayibacter sp. VKM Ac-2804]|uniref:hypothetical protein n=1 Tax=Rathayibacter sp. VKM Ac-2804 TaxID=2609257 RepID=UPI00132EBB7A|nr:hypothetical protein [Rathayibacter sp. VKM Ac-2804]QHF25738.1 hypothetical protein GTU73_18225 [Rathayibacter sp. VKM Ac-2804]